MPDISPSNQPNPEELSVGTLGDSQPAAAVQPTAADPIGLKPPKPLTPPSNGGLAKKVLMILVVIVVVATGVYVVGRYVTSKGQPAGPTKKDIPYLTLGSDETADLTQLYPAETADTDTSTQVNTQLFEGLVRYQQGTKIIPLLAVSWSNPNDSTWIFDLRHGVKFHNGRTMAAADVKYSLDYAVAHQNDNNGATLLSLASTIQQVDVINPYQVKITTDGPDPTLLNRLAYLYILDPKAKIGDPDAGTGPYIVKPGTKPTAGSMDIVADNNYWGGHVYTREVNITSTANDDQLAADTAKGQFDIAGDFTSQQLAKIKHYQPITIQDLGITFVGLNTLRPGSPLQSLPARKAAAYAMDVPAILKAGGLTGVKANQLVPPALPGYDPSIQSIPYNPAKAKQLLATVPNAAAPLTLSYPGGDDGSAKEIAKELHAVGFNVTTASITDLDTLVSVGLSGQTDMFYLADSTATLDGLQLFNDIVIGAMPQDYNNPTVSKLADQAATTLDPSSRITILQQMARQVANDIPDIPLFTQTRTVALMKPYHVQVDIPSIEPGVYFWQTYQE